MKCLFVIALIVHLTLGEYPDRDIFEIFTPDDTAYNFIRVDNNFMTFKVKAANDAHVGLFTGPHREKPWYEIVIGGWANTKSVIRYNGEDMVSSISPRILNKDKYEEFWVRFYDKTISIGLANEFDPFMVWRDNQELPNITYVGIHTGFGSTGNWMLSLPRYDFMQPSKECKDLEDNFVKE